VTEAHFGQRVSCPTCGEAFVVPELGKAASNTPPPQPPAKAPFDYRRWKPSPEILSGLSQASLWAGRPLVAVGLVLVLLARGCEAISQRGVQRADVKVQAAREELADSYQTKRLALEEKISDLEAEKDRKAPEDQALADLKTQLTDLAVREAKERKKYERGAWRDLETNARIVKTNQQINGYWREIFFVFASIVLATGLLLVSWTAQGAERWVALMMLAVLTVSIYIGGVAWGPLAR